MMLIQGRKNIYIFFGKELFFCLSHEMEQVCRTFAAEMEKTEYMKRYEQFLNEHPDRPKKVDIFCLKHIVTKQYAEEVIAGKKRIELFEFNDYYKDCLYDKNMQKYMHEHNILDWEFVSPLRQVRRIRYQDAEVSWYVDVRIEYNDVMQMTEEDVRFIKEQFGWLEGDKYLKRYEGVPQEQRPYFFFFVVEKVTKIYNGEL